MIIDKLIEKIKAKKSPIAVGLDTRQQYVPNFILEKYYDEYGNSLKAVSLALLDFNKAIIDEIYEIVPAVKIQIAMYEKYGYEGIYAYIKTIQYAKEKGLIIIGDIKRGDISSTALDYADGHIGEVEVADNSFSVYNQDFVTLNPYLGTDSIEPFLENCKKYEKGLFILAKTSNNSSFEIQNLIVDGVYLYEKVAMLIEKWGDSLIGNYGYSSVGAVVSAKHTEEAKKLRKLMQKTFFLVPGYGAQGGTAKDLSVCFDKNGEGAIINSSRGIIASYLSSDFKTEEKYFAKVAKDAVIKMQEDLLKYI